MKPRQNGASEKAKRRVTGEERDSTANITNRVRQDLRIDRAFNNVGVAGDLDRSSYWTAVETQR